MNKSGHSLTQFCFWELVINFQDLPLKIPLIMRLTFEVLTLQLFQHFMLTGPIEFIRYSFPCRGRAVAQVPFPASLFTLGLIRVLCPDISTLCFRDVETITYFIPIIHILQQLSEISRGEGRVCGRTHKNNNMS